MSDRVWAEAQRNTTWEERKARVRNRSAGTLDVLTFGGTRVVRKGTGGWGVDETTDDYLFGNGIGTVLWTAAGNPLGMAYGVGATAETYGTISMSRPGDKVFGLVPTAPPRVAQYIRIGGQATEFAVNIAQLYKGLQALGEWAQGIKMVPRPPSPGGPAPLVPALEGVGGTFEAAPAVSQALEFTKAAEGSAAVESLLRGLGILNMTAPPNDGTPGGSQPADNGSNSGTGSGATGSNGPTASGHRAIPSPDGKGVMLVDATGKPVPGASGTPLTAATEVELYEKAIRQGLEVSPPSWILHLRDNINIRDTSALLGPPNLRTLEMPKSGPELVKALEAMGMRQGREYSLIYMVRDARTGQVLKVGETWDPFGRFPEYLARASQEGRSVAIDIIPMERYARVGPNGQWGRIQVESSVRRGLSGEGHKLPWDRSGTGWAPGTGPQPPGDTPWYEAAQP